VESKQFRPDEEGTLPIFVYCVNKRKSCKYKVNVLFCFMF